MLDAIRWDSNLIHRYDLAGPRYTSYPTAVQFDSQVGSFDLLHALRDSRAPRFIDVRSVNSAILGHSIHCWVFAVQETTSSIA